MSEVTQTRFEGWALVEIMGHRRAAGLVTTEYIGQAAFLRIVTPEVPPTTYTVETDRWIDSVLVYAGSVMEVSRKRTEILVGTASVYAITPIDEADLLQYAPAEHKVIKAAERKQIEPVFAYRDREDDGIPF